MEAGELDAEELKVFLQEVDEQIQLLDEDFVRLEHDAENTELLQEIFRAAHTIKGSSGMLGFTRMAGLTHVMEDLLDKLRNRELSVTAELVDALLAGLDGIKVLKAGLMSGSGEEGALDIDPIVAQLKSVVGSEGDAKADQQAAASIESVVANDTAILERLEAAKADKLDAFVIRAALDPDSAWGAVRSFQIINELGQLGDVIHSIPTLEQIEQEAASSELQVLVCTAQNENGLESVVSAIEDVTSVDVLPWDPDAAAEERVADQGGDAGGSDERIIDLSAEARGKSQAEQLGMAAQKIETIQSVRIDVDQLDALMNIVGELIIDRTRIIEVSRVLQTRYRQDEVVQGLVETTAHIDRIIGELNEGMMKVRMMPVGTLFNKFPRLIRDLSRSTGKDIQFIIEGEDTEIDRAVIEKIKDPLVHMLRNAIDHGVEDPEVRKAARKPAQATVKLTAYHEQGNIMISLEDDGAGIDPEKMKTSAISKGIMSADAAARLSDAEAIDLIFESGFSTAKVTTAISGRGVGMDVVRRSIGEVNGIVKIQSQVGKGSIFTLQLPLTLATFRGLLVESAESVYAIPLSYVQETGRLDSSAIETIIDTEVVTIRGNVMPLLRLTSVCQTGQENGHQNGEAFIVVVKAGERPVAVAVDALRQQQEIVVKSLGAYMGKTEGIAGASILGDGQVVLILDVASVVKAAL